METALESNGQSPQRLSGLRGLRRFQEFIDAYPNVKKRSLRQLPVQSDVCWLEDAQRGHRLAIRPDDLQRLPLDGLLVAVRYAGQVYVLGICDGRVTAAILVLGAFGTDTIPWAG